MVVFAIHRHEFSVRAAATGAFSARATTPRPRSWAEAGRTPCTRGGGQEELPQVQGQGRQLRGATPHPRLGAEVWRTYPTPEARGSSLEELPHVRSQGWRTGGTTQHPRPGAVAERSYPTSEARGGRQEDLPHNRGQGRRPEGATPSPRSSGCAGTGRPRRAIPCSRSEVAGLRRYPSSNVRSSGCALLEQP